MVSGRAPRRRARLLAALVLAAGILPCPRARAALDVKLWPFFRYARDEAHGLVRWSALGPLVEFQGTPERRDLRIRPLLWLRQRRGPTRDDRADVLYPLAASRWQDDYRSFRLLLFTYRSRPVPAGPPATAPPPEVRRFTLFPFVFYRQSPETGTHLSVLPFYLDQPDFLGYERVQAIMFPAYLRLREPRLERRWYGFPFVSTLGGPDGRGVRVWPFFGTKEIVGRERSRYVLWPFYIRSAQLVPGYGWEERRIDFPIFAAIDGPVRRTRGWALGAYLHTVDFRHGTESFAAPWPFTVRQRVLGESDYRVWRVAPFYGRSERDGISSRFYAWPAYRRKTQDADDFHYERRDVGLLLWRSQRLDSEVSGRHERLLTVFAALRAEDRDGRRLGQVPALADSLLPRNRAVLALWAPLYGLVRWDTRPDGSRDWNLLWGLLAREGGRWIGPWHLATDGGAARRADGD